MLSTTIQLIPDWTIIPLLVTFVLLAIALTRFVFRPVLKILDARHAMTEGELERARMLEHAIEGHHEEMEQEFAALREEGVSAREKLRAEAYVVANDMLDAARVQSRAIEAQGASERERFVRQEAQYIDKEVPKLARIISHQILTNDGES